MKNRTGSFKEKILSTQCLQREAKILAPTFHALKKAQEIGIITGAEMCALYILIYQLVRTPKNSLQGKITLSTIRKTKLSEYNFNLKELWPTEDYSLLHFSLDEIYQLNFKGLPKKTNIAILNWLNGNWDLILEYKIPSPLEILELQINKKRCVTIITEENRLGTHILQKRDALSFAVHDLEHAVNFYQNEKVFLGQVGFYHFLKVLMEEVTIQNLRAVHPTFKKEFDYVISDMNAYSIHALKYTLGIIKRAFGFKEEFMVFFEHSLLKNLETKLHFSSHLIELVLKLEREMLLVEEEITLAQAFENLGQNYGKKDTASYSFA